MALELLLHEEKDSVAVITINRPDQLNALNRQIMEELRGLLDRYENDNSVSVLVITGIGKSFSAGADVKRSGDTESDPMTEFLSFARYTRETFHKVETYKKPIIAAINGYAMGGGLELALCCDIRVAAEEAKIGLTETKLGLVPGAGGTQRLPRLIGPAMAKQLIFTGGLVSGNEAYRIGLANAVAPREECLNKAVEIAKEIAERAPLAVQASKKCIDMSLQLDIESGLNYEIECVKAVKSSEDSVEGVRAFQEKRKPEWKNR